VQYEVEVRVISGKYKGRKLIAPKGESTRPTLDRTKETLFNMLAFDIPQSNCLDLFAGSGQIGIECLSRGASSCVFCDTSADAISVIKQNLSALGISGQQVLKLNYKTALASFAPSQFDLIYLDPPYEANFYVEALDLIDKQQLLSQDGQVVCECNQLFEIPVQFQVVKERKIGTVQFVFLKRKQQ